MAHLPPQSSFASLELSAVLDDLAARFIVNLPAEELESMDRVCFQIEQAHWYYEDFVRPMASNPSLLPSYSLKAFSLLMFKSCPLLHDLVPQHARIWTSFMQYKERVPVCGAVLINEWWDKVLLVKGWTKGSSWSFPRGKINKEEPEAMCAVREVLEETGFDLTSFFPPAQLHPAYVEPEGQERVPYYVELVIREQKIRLYFVPGVSERTRFETRTRKEISKIEWFSLSDLPTWSKEVANGAGANKKGKGAARTKTELANGRQAKFYMVTPFISHLKLWIDRNKPKNLPPRPASSSLSPYPAPARVPSPEESPVPFGGRFLKPWTDEVATSHLPSDGDESTEDDWAREDERIRASWKTMQQGTDALQALFFGAPESPVVHVRPLPVPTQQYAATPTGPSSSSAAATVTATPPHVAYERQQSFLQPVPKPSNQQSKLLELLAGAPATAPTPPPQQTLVHRLESLTLASPSPLAYLPSPLPAPALASAQAHHPLPLSPATVAAAQPAPPQTFAALNEDQKREKHDALLRALLSVAVKSPPRAPAVELAPAPAQMGGGGKGSLLSILNGVPVAAPAAEVPHAAATVAAKDPLQILREFRARQHGGGEVSPDPPALVPAPAPVPVQAPSPVPPPLPLPGAPPLGLHHPKPIPPPPSAPAPQAFPSPPLPQPLTHVAPTLVPHPHAHPQAGYVPYPAGAPFSTSAQHPHPHPHPHVLPPGHPAHTQVLAPYPAPPAHFHPHVPVPFGHAPFPFAPGPGMSAQGMGGYGYGAPPPMLPPSGQFAGAHSLLPHVQPQPHAVPPALPASAPGEQQQQQQRGNAGALLGLLNARG